MFNEEKLGNYWLFFIGNVFGRYFLVEVDLFFILILFRDLYVYVFGMLFVCIVNKWYILLYVFKEL